MALMLDLRAFPFGLVFQPRCSFWFVFLGFVFLVCFFGLFFFGLFFWFVFVVCFLSFFVLDVCLVPFTPSLRLVRRALWMNVGLVSVLNQWGGVYRPELNSMVTKGRGMVPKGLGNQWGVQA